VLPGEGFAAGLAHGLATSILFCETVAVSAPALEGAALTPTDEPGFGVEIDDAALERLRTR
jgi:L-alanine-DL-glutamate epimerase-like enolase superfamily enzyme